MMSFCKKSAHSFLGLASSSMDNPVFLPPPSDHTSSSFFPVCHHDAIPAVGGLGFIAVSEEIHRPANVIESAVVVKAGPPKRDPGGIGFIDEVGGGVDGLMSCTESLGFESSDERRVDDEMKNCYDDAAWGSTSEPLILKSSRWREAGGERREARRFPPPLPSLNHNGQPSFFLRPVRKDGRLEITKVRIDRPEILRASRQGGRLTLHLIIEEEDEGVEKEEEEEEEEAPPPPQEDMQEELQEEEEKEEDTDVDAEYEEEVVEEWRLTAAVGSSSGGEGLRRCHELVQQHHHQHHHLHGWCQPCVTSR